MARFQIRVHFIPIVTDVDAVTTTTDAPPDAVVEAPNKAAATEQAWEMIKGGVKVNNADGSSVIYPPHRISSIYLSEASEAGGKLP